MFTDRKFPRLTDSYDIFIIKLLINHLVWFISLEIMIQQLYFMAGWWLYRTTVIIK